MNQILSENRQMADALAKSRSRCLIDEAAMRQGGDEPLPYNTTVGAGFIPALYNTTVGAGFIPALVFASLARG
jgi:hypothetical protein